MLERKVSMSGGVEDMSVESVSRRRLLYEREIDSRDLAALEATLGPPVTRERIR